MFCRCRDRPVGMFFDNESQARTISIVGLEANVDTASSIPVKDSIDIEAVFQIIYARNGDEAA